MDNLTLTDAQRIASAVNTLCAFGLLPGPDAFEAECRRRYPEQQWALWFDFTTEPHAERLMVFERVESHAE